ncbi:periplasmic binding protein-like II [Coprinellus micaceus]|uniref:Periplasmic binding protein-like II n=1 Tax=Coprinellus micaceus TaxID=71717 RepID=A0A4Y7STH6_COPMI|nr:periplasmic binding protein-like II [Coprinellus micaceus]
MVLRVGYVREHFSSPILQLAEQDGGKTFTLVECPSGTGQIISGLTNNEIDVAIALTDALITGVAKGSKAYRLVGSYVSSPLNWAVITGKDTRYQNIDDLKDTTLGISRYGSGSQVMAYVMALQKGWPTDQLKFQVNNDIHGLVDSVNEGSTSAFMWEWFTTKPWVDQGKARFIGSVPTPWPSWLIVANQERANAAEVKDILERLTGFIRDFDSEEKREKANVEFIKEKFGYLEEDVRAWLKTVKYPQNCLEIPIEVITATLSTLEKAGVLTAPEGGFNVSDFISSEVVKLT